jgi:hypothetical protein
VLIQIDIPRHVDITKLRCIITGGLLKVELDPSMSSSSSESPISLPAAKADGFFSKKLIVNENPTAASLSIHTSSAGATMSHVNSAGTGRCAKDGPFITDSSGMKR